jgi:hypothetical protein
MIGYWMSRIEDLRGDSDYAVVKRVCQEKKN